MTWYRDHWNDQTYYKVATGKVGGVTQYEQVGVSVQNYLATNVRFTTNTIIRYYTRYIKYLSTY